MYARFYEVTCSGSKEPEPDEVMRFSWTAVDSSEINCTVSEAAVRMQQKIADRTPLGTHKSLLVDHNVIEDPSRLNCRWYVAYVMDSSRVANHLAGQIQTTTTLHLLQAAKDWRGRFSDIAKLAKADRFETALVLDALNQLEATLAKVRSALAAGAPPADSSPDSTGT